jgi:hypothetical protein
MQRVTRYNWVGFYFAHPADPGILLVGCSRYWLLGDHAVIQGSL